MILNSIPSPSAWHFLCNSNPSTRCHVRVALQRGQMAGKVTVTVGWDSRAKFRQIWASERLNSLAEMTAVLFSQGWTLPRVSCESQCCRDHWKAQLQAAGCSSNFMNEQPSASPWPRYGLQSSIQHLLHQTQNSCL